MAFTVIYDANALFPAPLRDLLIGVAQTGIARARWTEQILDECFRNILARRPDLSESSLRRTRELMNRAIRDVLVTGHEALLPDACLPDPNDRHVLAAAVRAGAQVIVTFNLRDFPEARSRRSESRRSIPTNSFSRSSTSRLAWWPPLSSSRRGVSGTRP
jgi:predicted nucleic acid-binding protein